MTLNQGKIGTSYKIEGLSITGNILKRLEALGLIKGTLITILNNKKSGTIIFKVRGTRLAVGKQIAEAIEVAKQ